MSEAVLAKFAEMEKQYQLPSGVMAKIAKIESNGNAQALNGSTQAGGIFQWIPRYWPDAARKAIPDSPGALNPQNRFNPFIASEVTAYNLAYIRTVIGSRIQQANADLSVGLYMGHFLGAAGAGKFFAAMIQNPNANAAQIFPNEAKYNGGVFGGRTIAGVYNYFAAKMNQPGITGVSNYDGSYTGPMTSRIMDSLGNTALSKPYAAPAQPATDSYRTYPTTYNQAQDTATVNSYFNGAPLIPDTTLTPATTPSASLIIAQSSRISKGHTTLISWVSVGMNPSSCRVTQDGTAFGSGTQGSKLLTADLTQDIGSIDFVFECTSIAGGTAQTSLTVQVR